MDTPACYLTNMNLFTLTPSVMFVNFRCCSFQLLWNNPIWLVRSNFLPTLQLTKLHQLAMQHIPLPSLGQSNPTFPGTYPRLPREVHLSLFLSSLLLNRTIKQPCHPTQDQVRLYSVFQTISKHVFPRWTLLWIDWHISKQDLMSLSLILAFISYQQWSLGQQMWLLSTVS